MGIKREFYCTRISPFVLKISQNLVPVDENNFLFSGLSLDELAIVGKENEEAKNEFLRRVNYEIELQAQCFIKKKNYIDLFEIYATLEDTCLACIKIYDIKRGHVINLLRRMMKISLLYKTKAVALKHAADIKYFGKRIQNQEHISYLYDNAVKIDDKKDEIIFKIDIEEYKKEITPLEREILDLYSLSLSFREIAEILGMTLSSVSHKVYLMLDELKRRYKVK